MAFQGKGMQQSSKSQSLLMNGMPRSRWKAPKLLPPKPIYPSCLPKPSELSRSFSTCASGDGGVDWKRVGGQGNETPSASHGDRQHGWPLVPPPSPTIMATCPKEHEAKQTKRWMGGGVALSENKGGPEDEEGRGNKTEDLRVASPHTSSLQVVRHETRWEKVSEVPEMDEQEDVTWGGGATASRVGASSTPYHAHVPLKKHFPARTRSLTEAFMGRVAVGPTVVIRSSKSDVKVAQQRSGVKSWCSVVPLGSDGPSEQLLCSSKDSQRLCGTEQDIAGFPQLDEAVRDEGKGHKAMQRSKDSRGDECKKFFSGSKIQAGGLSTSTAVLSNVGQGGCNFLGSFQPLPKPLLRGGGWQRFSVDQSQTKRFEPLDVVSQFSKFPPQRYFLDEPLPPFHSTRASQCNALVASPKKQASGCAECVSSDPMKKTKSGQQVNEAATHDAKTLRPTSNDSSPASHRTVECPASCVTDGRLGKRESSIRRFQRVKEYQIEFFNTQNNVNSAACSAPNVQGKENAPSGSTPVGDSFHKDVKEEKSWRTPSKATCSAFHVNDSRLLGGSGQNCRESMPQRSAIHSTASGETADQVLLGLHGRPITKKYSDTPICVFYSKTSRHVGGLWSGSLRKSFCHFVEEGWRCERYAKDPHIQNTLTSHLPEPFLRVDGLGDMTQLSSTSRSEKHAGDLCTSSAAPRANHFPFPKGQPKEHQKDQHKTLCSPTLSKSRRGTFDESPYKGLTANLSLPSSHEPLDLARANDLPHTSCALSLPNETNKHSGFLHHEARDTTTALFHGAPVSGQLSLGTSAVPTVSRPTHVLRASQNPCREGLTGKATLDKIKCRWGGERRSGSPPESASFSLPVPQIHTLPDDFVCEPSPTLGQGHDCGAGFEGVTQGSHALVAYERNTLQLQDTQLTHGPNTPLWNSLPCCAQHLHYLTFRQKSSLACQSVNKTCHMARGCVCFPTAWQVVPLGQLGAPQQCTVRSPATGHDLPDSSLPCHVFNSSLGRCSCYRCPFSHSLDHWCSMQSSCHYDGVFKDHQPTATYQAEQIDPGAQRTTQHCDLMYSRARAPPLSPLPLCHPASVHSLGNPSPRMSNPHFGLPPKCPCHAPSVTPKALDTTGPLHFTSQLYHAGRSRQHQGTWKVPPYASTVHASFPMASPPLEPPYAEGLNGQCLCVVTPLHARSRAHLENRWSHPTPSTNPPLLLLDSPTCRNPSSSHHHFIHSTPHNKADPAVKPNEPSHYSWKKSPSLKSCHGPSIGQRKTMPSSSTLLC